MQGIRSTMAVLVMGILGMGMSLGLAVAPEKSWQARSMSDDPPASCRVTTPSDPAFVPPAPYPGKGANGNFYFGTAKLWTLVWKSPWRDLPKWDVDYRQKIVW